MKQPTLALLLLLLAAAAAASKQAKRDWLADLRTEEAVSTSWHKRSDEQQQADHLIASLGAGNSQFLLRSPRNSRQYDVPQIGKSPEQQLAARDPLSGRARTLVHFSDRDALLVWERGQKTWEPARKRRDTSTEKSRRETYLHARLFVNS